MEYGINKIPAVYSAHHYKDVIVNRTNGIIAETEDDWVAGLSYLIENEEERKRIGKNAYNDVMKNWDMNKHLHEWEEFILSL